MFILLIAVITLSNEPHIVYTQNFPTEIECVERKAKMMELFSETEAASDMRIGIACAAKK